jgi:hypothetical protein
MCAADVRSVPAEQWTLYQRALVDIDFGSRTLRVSPGPPEQTAGFFPSRSGRTVHVVTAFNPGGRTATTADNDRAHHVLLGEIEERGTTWWPATGGDAGGVHTETSVAVIGLSDGAACELGRRFGQDAVFAWTPGCRRLLSCFDDSSAESGWRAATLAANSDLARPHPLRVR